MYFGCVYGRVVIKLMFFSRNSLKIVIFAAPRVTSMAGDRISKSVRIVFSYPLCKASLAFYTTAEQLSLFTLQFPASIFFRSSVVLLSFLLYSMSLYYRTAYICPFYLDARTELTLFHIKCERMKLDFLMVPSCSFFLLYNMRLFQYSTSVRSTWTLVFS